MIKIYLQFHHTYFGFTKAQIRLVVMFFPSFYMCIADGVDAPIAVLPNT